MIHHTQSSPIVVTGAAGFIASHLIQALLTRGEHVVGIDNFDPYYPRSAKEANLAAIDDPYGRFQLVEGDCCDALLINGLMGKHRPKGVIHLAAKAGVRPSISDPVAYSRANVVGTSVVLAAAHNAGCERVVVASSSSVYGNCPTAPFSETMDVNAPISPYAATKRACELLAHTHHYLTSQPVACLRFFTVYGPRQRPDLAIANFLHRVAAGQPLRVFGDGTSSRDYTYVADIVAGVLAAYERVDKHGYRVWNLGNSSPVTLNEMIKTIETVVGKRAVLERAPAQPGDVERTWADLARSREELDYQPTVTFAQGVTLQYEAHLRAAAHGHTPVGAGR